WADKVTGDHEVVRFVNRDPMRVKSVRGRIDGPGLHDVEAGVVLHHTPWSGAIRATHKRHEKAPVAERGELIGDGRFRRIVRADERWMAWIGDVEEEDLILTPQNAEQATESQRPPIAGETNMVRLVANGAGSRQRYGAEYSAVVRRAALEVDYGDEVWCAVRLVPC